MNTPVEKPSPFIARGHVRLFDGSPLVGGVVRAYDKGVRSRQLLGETHTDEKGLYEIRLNPEKLACAETLHPDLMIEVLRNSKEEADPLVRSGILFHAPSGAIIDLIVPIDKIRVPSEMERNLEAIDLLLAGQGVALSDFTQDDVAYISGRTGIERSRVEFLVSAVRFEQETKVNKEVFYAFSRKGLPAELQPLLEISPQQRAEALDAAVAENIIRPFAGDERSNAFQRLSVLAEDGDLARLLRPGAGAKALPLGKILDVARLSVHDQRVLGRAWMTAGGNPERVWNSLKGPDGKLPPPFAIAQKTLALAGFLDNHVPLVHALVASSELPIQSVKDLAKLEVNQWKELTYAKCEGHPAGFPPDTPGATDDEKAHALVRMVEAAFPVERTMHRLRADGIPGLADDGLNRTVKALVTQEPLNLGYADIDAYVSNHPALPRADAAQQADIICELKKVQRVFRLTPRASEWSILLQNGVSSAHDILAMGKTRFLDDFVGKIAAPAALYEQAQRAAAANLLFATGFRVHQPWSDVSVVSSPADAAGKIPNLQNLFGSLDHCECAPCQAVTSPAAYFTDLLAFLKNPDLNDGVRTAYESLCGKTGRRPDLANLELSCPNTEAEIPLIDLVNEILENAVANTTRPGWLSDTFAWQTSGTSAQRQLHPEHLDATAYDQLKSAVFPWSLPYDVWLVSLRCCLPKLDLNRARLIELFRSVADAAAKKTLACELLNLMPVDYDAISAEPTSANAWRYWFRHEPLAATDWRSRLGAPLSDFLHRSQLTCVELLELLRTRYVNAGRTLRVEPAESCNLEELKLMGLDADTLQRLHAFVRLQRRIGLTPRDLDHLAGAVTGSARFSDASLQELAQALRLKGDLKLPTPLLASLWRDKLDTYGYRDDNGADGSSIYDHLFQNPFLLPAQAIQKLRLTPSRDELLQPLDRQSLAALAPCLNVSADDLGQLFQRHAASSGAVDLIAFSRIVREILLARALELSVADMLRFCELVGYDPLATPSNTRKFVATVRGVSASISRDDRMAILGPPSAQPSAETQTKIDELRKLLLKAEAQIEQETPSEDPASASNLATPDQSRSGRLRAQALAHVVLVDLAIVETLWTWSRKWDVANDKKLGEAIATFEVVPTLQMIYGSFARLRILIAGLGLTAGDFNCVSVRDKLLSIIDNPSDVEKLRCLEDLIRLTQLRRKVDQKGGRTLLDVLTPSLDPAARSRALLELGLDIADASNAGTLLPVLGLTVDDLTDAATLARLHGCVLACRSVGVSPHELAAWAGDTIGPEQCVSARSAISVRAGAGVVQVAKELQDDLRARQRDALTAYLLGAEDRELRDANDLFDRFLIDVETGACKRTTRMAQAIASVQLFVEQCLANLRSTDDVVLNDKAAQWWVWMKRYRVWEANRKVFLYPENWLRPELRDDKTPYFKELESELMQQPITQQNVEKALRGYLHKLSEVARLQVCGMYLDGANPSAGELHVISRSVDEPCRYYYRKQLRDLPGAPWTPWEKVEAEIEGDHFIPVVFKGRLFLFWPLFEEELAPPRLRFGPMNRAIELGALERAIADACAEVKNQLSVLPGQIKSAIDAAGAKIAITLAEMKQAIKDLPGLLSSAAPAPPDPGSRPPGPDFTNLLDLNPLGVLQANAQASSVAPPTFSDLLPAKRWIVKLAWVERRNDKWTGKNISSCALTYRDPTAYFLKGMKRRFTFRGTADDDKLEIGCYLEDRHVGAFQLRSDIGTLTTVQSDQQQEIPLPSVESIIEQQGPRLPALPRNPGRLGILPVRRQDETAPQLTSVMPHQNFQISAYDRSPTFYFLQDNERVFFVENADPRTPTVHLFYHPYVPELIRLLDWDGLARMMARSVQVQSRDILRYTVDSPIVLPQEAIEFRSDGAYSQYNWEIFIHAPWLIAAQLSAQRRFQEAQAWLHYLFDPTSREGTGPQRYWRAAPLHDLSDEAKETKRIERLLVGIGTEADQADQQALEGEVEQWRNDPFEPFAIARGRIVAFQKTIVLKYVQNLIAWGDEEFRSNKSGSLNEAARLYVLAAQILGRRPDEVRLLPSDSSSAKAATFAELPSLDDFSNSYVELENLLVLPNAWNALALAQAQPGGTVAPIRSRSGKADQATALLTSPSWKAGRRRPTGRRVPLFCVPANDELEKCWCDIADRLFNLRNCRDIDGERLDLPPFAPPIDPEVLIRAKALGVNVTEVLADRDAPLQYYRFNILAQKATELCAEVKALGGALLAALEKRDAEELTRLRHTHEITVLNAVTEVRRRHVDEARRSLQGLAFSKRQVLLRLAYYVKQLAEFYNPFEVAALSLQGGGLAMTAIQTAANLLSASGSLIPDFKAGFVTTLGAQYGGRNVTDAMKGVAGAWGSVASMLSSVASMVGTVGGYVRRAEDWALQIGVLGLEERHLEKQIAAAQLKLEIAEHEHDNHKLQVEHAKEVDEYLREKFTKLELYTWMVEQLSEIYCQGYQLAFDVAKRAQRAYEWELGRKQGTANFVLPDYWVSTRQGLLAGERLLHDLKRMEAAFLEQNERTYEITKHVSIAILDPPALIQLRETGACEVILPEALFDMDYPGHYLRRVKSVSVTIPCVAGPYTGVSCTLTMTNGTVRIHGELQNAYMDGANYTDPNFAAAQTKIVTSNAQNDSGLFETQLRDERCLPFEGAGLINSRWRLELPSPTGFPQFDYATISDVVLHIRYTSLPGDNALRNAAIQYLDALISQGKAPGSVRLFSLHHEFPTAWARFKSVTLDATTPVAELTVQLREEHYPFWSRGKLNTVKRVELFAKTANDSMNIRASRDGPGNLVTWERNPSLGEILHGTLTNFPLATPTGMLTLFADDNSMENLWLAMTWGNENGS